AKSTYSCLLANSSVWMLRRAKRTQQRFQDGFEDDEAPLMVQLDGRVRYCFPEGKKTIIGGPGQDTKSSETPAPDVSLLGAGIRRLHASVVNEDSRCVLTALSMDAAKATCLNGFRLDKLLQAPELVNRELLGYGLELQHRDHLKFGHCYFVFVNPTEGSLEALIASGQADFYEAQIQETRARSIEQRLFSPNQVLPGLDDMRDIAEELEQKKRELQMKDSLLRAKDEEVEQLRSELDALREGRHRHDMSHMCGTGRLEVGFSRRGPAFIITRWLP
ncbi:kif1, partial [Symbiodinium sp. CCMP2456]